LFALPSSTIITFPLVRLLIEIKIVRDLEYILTMAINNPQIQSKYHGRNITIERSFEASDI
jgi:hypothetical protein